MNTLSTPTARNRILLVGLVFWIVLVFAHYFSWHQVFDFSFLSAFQSTFAQADLHKLALNWMNFLKVLLCDLAIGFVLWRVGRRLFYWMGLDSANTALRFCLEMALGILLLNTLWLGLGFNGLWFNPLLKTIAVLLFGFALCDFRKGFLKIQKFQRVSIPGKFFILVGLLGLLSFVLSLFQGMIPDVYYDALVYHLSTLQFWLDHHGIADFYTNLYSYFPFGGELYFFNGFFLAGSEAAKMLNTFASGLCGLAAAGWVAEETGWDKGLLAWTMVLTLPLVSATVWTTQNDVMLAFFLVLFLYTLNRWVEKGRTGSWVLMAGLVGGAALTIKYTAVISVIVILLALVVAFPKSAFKPNRRQEWLLMFALLALSIAPWLLKNAAFTGNSFYPYLSSCFGGRSLPAQNMKALLGDQEAVLNGNFSPINWASQVLGKDLDKTIAPLLFGFAPLLFLAGRKNLKSQFLLLASILLLTTGFLISYQLRLQIPAFMVCFLAIGMILGDVENKTATYFWGGAVMLFGALSLLSLCRLSTDYYQSQKIWFGNETRKEYLAHAPQTSSYYGLAQTANSLPPDSQVLVVGDARGLYYPRPFYTNSVFDEQVVPKLAREENDAAGIRKRLREMGVDAIIVSWEEAKRLGLYPARALPTGDEKKLGEFFGFDVWLQGGIKRRVLLKL